MQAHELLVEHMRLHNFQGGVVGLGVFRNQPPGLMFGLFPDTVGSKFQKHWMHSSAHSDPKEVPFIITWVLFWDWGDLGGLMLLECHLGSLKRHAS